MYAAREKLFNNDALDVYKFFVLHYITLCSRTLLVLEESWRNITSFI